MPEPYPFFDAEAPSAPPPRFEIENELLDDLRDTVDPAVWFDAREDFGFDAVPATGPHDVFAPRPLPEPEPGQDGPGGEPFVPRPEPEPPAATAEVRYAGPDGTVFYWPGTPEPEPLPSPEPPPNAYAGLPVSQAFDIRGD